MFGTLKKHGGKILVFIINFLLATITVFAIREKDLNRLLKNAENERKNENAAPKDVPSFENSINIEEQKETDAVDDPPAENVPNQKNASDPTAGSSKPAMNSSSSKSPASNSPSSKKKSSGSSGGKSSSSSPQSSSSSSSSSSSQNSSSGSSNAKTKTS